MIEELSRSIRAHLSERVTNPLLGAVSVSWVFWNYKLLLILGSSATSLEKIEFIEHRLYPEWYLTALFLIVLPLVSGMAFLYAYPVPAKLIYRYTQGNLKELKKIKLEVDDETPASQEEYIQLKRMVNEFETRYYTDLTEKDSEISRLQSLLAASRQNPVQPQKVRLQTEPESGSVNAIKGRKELQQFVEDGKITHKKIVGICVAGNRYELGKEIKSDEPGKVSVFSLSKDYQFEEIIPVQVELNEPLESNQVLWVFDGYSFREIDGLEFELQKADFEKKSARVEVHQPNPLKPGKHVVVSNIVQFQY